MASCPMLLDLTLPQNDAAMAEHCEIADIGDGAVFLEIITLLEDLILIASEFIAVRMDSFC